MSEVSLVILLFVLVLLIALLVVVKTLRLPQSFYKNEERRSEIRKRIIEHEANHIDDVDDEPPG
jgi:hypothetical protein